MVSQNIVSLGSGFRTAETSIYNVTYGNQRRSLENQTTEEEFACVVVGRSIINEQRILVDIT